MLRRILNRLILITLINLCTACAQLYHHPIAIPSQEELAARAKILASKTKNIKPEVIQLALQAYYKARSEGFDQQGILTVIDYSKPSNQRRFWVFDLKTNQLLFEEYVAHGKNSGDKVATHFSNDMGSMTSSIGLYVTAKFPYMGRHGYSLRLAGLDKGFNNLAAERAIVVHGATYVSKEFAKVYGKLGLSWGCPALNPKMVKPIIDHIKGGTLIFAYYPDKKWIQESHYLNL
ncbi:MAG: hypothetical protein LEGION0398_MBIBDBAK_01108 [Legionellaceae bacterium]